MAQMQWSDQLNIGMEFIDSAHKKLFAIMNRMLKLNENPKNYQLLCQEGIKYLKNYALQHFAEEESYMQSIHYQGYELHKKLHDNLRDKTLPILEQEVIEADYSVESVQHFMNICIAWLTQHIMSEDRAIVGKIPNKRILECTPGEVHSLAEITASCIQNIFHQEAQIASEYYRGENIGESVFYRLTYRSGQNKPIIVYLGFELKLILSMAESITGTVIKTVNKIPPSAIQQLSKQIMDAIGEHIPDAKSCTLEKENIISYDLLVKTFYNGYPSYSMMFRTNGGYFVFCIQT